MWAGDVWNIMLYKHERQSMRESWTLDTNITAAASKPSRYEDDS